MVFIRTAFKNTFLFLLIIFISCVSGIKTPPDVDLVSKNHITSNNTFSESKLNDHPILLVGANQMAEYIPKLQNKKVAIVGNQTSVIFKDSVTNQNYTHLVDSLIASGIAIQKVFAPEHGFRGKADAAELVADGKDIKTGLPIISLYGKSKKPSSQALEGIDIVVFDIQDVGVRFYTYISTLHYVMQACAENNIPLLILDRPNPNGHYIDGPTLESEHSSFIGKHPIPLVHGMTIGEYAQMINGEGWLGKNLQCTIDIIKVLHYDHSTPYQLPIRPSPNLPNDIAINLYPSLGLFEGTTVNAGRGTENQFQIYGSPNLDIEKYNYQYTPQPNFGAKYPKHRGEICYGEDLRTTKALDTIRLDWLINAYQNSKDKASFFKTKSFTSHAGTKLLQQQIEARKTAIEIKASWKAGIEAFITTRKKYLLYN